MPRIIDYDIVLQRMTAQGYVSLYHNSGAFAFAREMEMHFVGWVGPDDPTLRPTARDASIPVPPPYEQNLAKLLVDFWRADLRDAAAWLMPMSHWSYELEFGSEAWMPQILREAGIEPEALRPRANGTAIEFSIDEAGQLQNCLRVLLENLTSSDFAVVFPGRPLLCTVHHHKQLWWTTSDLKLARSLREAVSSSG